MNMRRLYRKIAKVHGVSAAEVKKEIQAAIDSTYQNPEKTEKQAAQQQLVPAIAKVPTAEELIAYAAQQLNQTNH